VQLLGNRRPAGPWLQGPDSPFIESIDEFAEILDGEKAS
jgi:hypothetical protein